jgi:hypothetical protein
MHDSRPDSTFPGDMHELSIFSSLGSRPQIQILSTYCGSLRHFESFESFSR